MLHYIYLLKSTIKYKITVKRNVNVVKALKEKIRKCKNKSQYNKIRKPKYNERYCSGLHKKHV